MNEQNNSPETFLFQRAIFAATLANLLTCERDLSHDEIRFHICRSIGKMLEDGFIAKDHIEMTLVTMCNDYAEQHNALVEARAILSGQN